VHVTVGMDVAGSAVWLRMHTSSAAGLLFLTVKVQGRERARNNYISYNL
jgi:hypothetical protein